MSRVDVFDSNKTHLFTATLARVPCVAEHVLDPTDGRWLYVESVWHRDGGGCAITVTPVQSASAWPQSFWDDRE